MSSTVITSTGLKACCLAGLYGPEIKITKVKVGSNLITPTSSMTDVSGLVWEGGVESIRYQVANDSTVIFKVTLDQNVGDFDIGNIGLYLDTGELFCITGLPAVSFKQKANLPDVAGNRRIFNIPIVLSGIATILDLSILIADEANIPSVNTELDLPDPLVAPFSVYEVLNHTQFGVPVLALRVDSNWWYIPSQLSGGQGIQLSPEDFDVIDPPQVGDAVRYNISTHLFEKADGDDNENGYMGIRGDNSSIILDGVYKNTTSTPETPAYSMGTKYYVDGGINKGHLTSKPTAWYVGIAIDNDRLLLNKQHINLATTDYPGNVELATVEEAIAGGDQQKAITPYTLARSVTAKVNEFSNGQFYIADSNSVQDWTSLHSGNSVFGTSLINHSRDNWIEGPNYFVRLRHSSMDESQLIPSKFYQRIPIASKHQGQTKVISFRARGSADGMSVAVGGSINFGTGGAPSDSIELTSTNIVITSDWATYEATVEIPQLVGVYNFGTNNDDYIEYYLGVYANSMNYVDIDWIKLEVGTYATSIESTTPEYCVQSSGQFVYYPWTFTKPVTFKNGIITFGNSIYNGNHTFNGETTFNAKATFTNILETTGTTNFNGTNNFGGSSIFNALVDVNNNLNVDGIASFNNIANFNKDVNFLAKSNFSGPIILKPVVPQTFNDSYIYKDTSGNLVIRNNNAGSSSIINSITLNANGYIYLDKDLPDNANDLRTVTSAWVNRRIQQSGGGKLNWGAKININDGYTVTQKGWIFCQVRRPWVGASGAASLNGVVLARPSSGYNQGGGWLGACGFQCQVSPGDKFNIGNRDFAYFVPFAS